MSVAVVTNANRVKGDEVTRQLADAGRTVYLGSRDPDDRSNAANGPHRANS